jgi:penicillin-binding protein 2
MLGGMKEADAIESTPKDSTKKNEIIKSDVAVDSTKQN